MKETVFSIRAYFGLVGFFGVIRSIFMFLASSTDWVLMIDASISFLLGAGFLYSSLKLPKLLQTSTKFVQILLYITMGVNALVIVLNLLIGLPTVESIIPVFTILIAWYLHLNVKRLEEEHSSK